MGSADVTSYPRELPGHKMKWKSQLNWIGLRETSWFKMVIFMHGLRAKNYHLNFLHGAQWNTFMTISRDYQSLLFEIVFWTAHQTRFSGINWVWTNKVISLRVHYFEHILTSSSWQWLSLLVTRVYWIAKSREARA